MSRSPLDKSGLAPRRAALQALLAWQKTGAFLQESLQELVQPLDALDSRLAWELAYGVCRRHRRLQHAVRSYCERAPKPDIEMALCLGLYQLFFLDRIPHHAVVHSGVALVRELSQGAASFANAVLQRALRDGLPPLPTHSVQSLALEYSMPDWLVEKWLAELQGDALALETRLQQSRNLPTQWIRLNLSRTNADFLCQQFSLEHTQVWRQRWIDVGPRLSSLLQSPAFACGDFSVQNPAAQLLVDLLELKPGLRVWDACAAPGGKTALMLELEPSIELLASDIDPRRLLALQDLGTRLGLSSFQVQACDAAQPPQGLVFDRILLDVPCSNLGVLARRPEVPQRLAPTSLAQMAAKQLRILCGAAQALAPGGVLVYATCSPEKEETLDVIRAFLAKHPDFVWEDAANYVESTFVRNSSVYAEESSLGFDGFFGARLRRLVQS